jgi:hypothetical protein
MHSNTTAAPEQPQNSAAKRPRPKVRRRPKHTALDARTWQFQLLTKTKAELLAHIGPSPSITQKALAERAAWLTVYVAEMDAKATAGEFMSDHASRQYLAWSNALARTLARLGPPAKAGKADLASYIQGRAAA